MLSVERWNAKFGVNFDDLHGFNPADRPRYRPWRRRGCVHARHVWHGGCRHSTMQASSVMRLLSVQQRQRLLSGGGQAFEQLRQTGAKLCADSRASYAAGTYRKGTVAKSHGALPRRSGRTKGVRVLPKRMRWRWWALLRYACQEIPGALRRWLRDDILTSR